MHEPGKLFANLVAAPHAERFDPILNAAGVRIVRIVSNDYRSPPGEWFDQAEDEWVVLLRGRAALEFGQPPATRILEAGDHLHIPAGCRHRIAWAGTDEPAVWLAVHLPPAA